MERWKGVWKGVAARISLLAKRLAERVSLRIENFRLPNPPPVRKMTAFPMRARLSPQAPTFTRTNQAGQLAEITDAVGMTSRFAYAGGGVFISEMDTPYGHTSFASGGDANGNLWVQATQIVEGLPAKERVELRVQELADDPAAPGGVPPAQEPAEAVPAGMRVRNEELNRRNTFYWDRRAMAEMGNPEPGGLFNYDKARVTHWMYHAQAGILYDIPASTKGKICGRGRSLSLLLPAKFHFGGAERGRSTASGKSAFPSATWERGRTRPDERVWERGRCLMALN